MVSKGRRGDGTRSQRERFGNSMLLALKMEEGTMSLGWGRKESDTTEQLN